QVPEAVVLRNGLMLRLAPGAPEITDEAPAGRLYLDGDAQTEADEGAVQERRRLAFAGAIFVGVTLDKDGRVRGDPQIRMLGIPEEDMRGVDFANIAFDALDDALE